MDAAGINNAGESGGIEENKDLIAEDIEKEKEAEKKSEEDVSLKISEISDIDGADTSGGFSNSEANLNAKEEAELMELMKERETAQNEEASLLEQVKQDAQKVTDTVVVDVELPKEMEAAFTATPSGDDMNIEASIETKKVGEAIDTQNIERVHDHLDHIEDSAGRTKKDIETIATRTEADNKEFLANTENTIADQNEETLDIEDAIQEKRKEHKDIDNKRIKGIADDGQMLRDRQKREETTVVGNAIETETNLNDSRETLDSVRDQLGKIEDKIRGVKSANPEAAKKVAE